MLFRSVGLSGQEGRVIRMTILPTLYYLVVTGIITLAAIHVLGIADPLMQDIS